MMVPATQRSPSAKGTLVCAVPWKYMQGPFGMSEPCRTRLSLATLALPVDSKSAPSGLTELAQPWPVAPELPHGHAVLVPSPKQYGCPVVQLSLFCKSTATPCAPADARSA